MCTFMYGMYVHTCMCTVPRCNSITLRVCTTHTYMCVYTHPHDCNGSHTTSPSNTLSKLMVALMALCVGWFPFKLHDATACTDTISRFVPLAWWVVQMY